MKNISGEAIILTKKPFLEQGILLNVFFRNHGKYVAILKWGQSSKYRSIIQVGNVIDLTWQARLDENLGIFVRPEIIKAHGNLIISNPYTCDVLTHVCQLLDALLEQRQPRLELYDALLELIARLNQKDLLINYIFFEIEMLYAFGYGLNINDKVVNEVSEELIYLSPKTARPVGREKGDKYKDKLLKLPAYILNYLNKKSENLTLIDEKDDLDYDSLSEDEINDGLKLTTFFLHKFIDNKTLTKRQSLLELILKKNLI